VKGTNDGERSAREDGLESSGLSSGGSGGSWRSRSRRLEGKRRDVSDAGKREVRGFEESGQVGKGEGREKEGGREGGKRELAN